MTITCHGDERGPRQEPTPCFEQALPAGGAVPSYLTDDFEVVCYVLEGVVSVQIGDQYLEAAPARCSEYRRRHSGSH